MNDINRFNNLCDKLKHLHRRSYRVPLPKPLPIKLDELRNHSNILEDVWILPQDKIPRWVEDSSIRKGIRAMLRQDQVVVERRRLGAERDNMTAWFGRELSAIRVASVIPECTSCLS